MGTVTDDMTTTDRDPVLRLGHSLETLRPTLHNGPGWRIGIWVQGCSLRCTATCLNERLLSQDGGHLVTVADLVAAIAATAGADDGITVEGITILGGEPTDQAEALVPLLDLVRSRGLSVMTYTGHTLAGLRRSPRPSIAALLERTDILVDAPYRADRYDDRLAWRGSSNQTLHLLSDRYSSGDLERAFRTQGKSFSFRFGADGSRSLSGFQDRKAAKQAEGWVNGADGG